MARQVEELFELQLEASGVLEAWAERKRRRVAAATAGPAAP